MDDLGVGAMLRADEAGGYLLSELQARERADAYRADAERLEAQVAALRAENEVLRFDNQRLQRELDHALVENAARRAQAKLLVSAAKAADLPVVKGEVAEYKQVFRSVFDAEAAARNLPVTEWNK